MEGPDKPWVGLETSFNEVAKLLFAASTKITIVDGNTTCFWYSAWIEGRRKVLAPRE